MIAQGLAMHFVCTHEEAAELIRGRENFWVCNCGCREKKGACGRSRMDVCLFFVDTFSTGSGKHPATKVEVMGILAEAKDKGLVARPFRDESREKEDGVCFCCDDCCEYFTNPEERCDPGRFVESTDMSICTHCGVCVEPCHFGAREMKDDILQVDSSKCYGCGLCLAACPEVCIRMVPRI